MANETNTPRNSRGIPLADRNGIWVFTWNEIINGFMQLVSVIAALIFGAWAVKSFDAAQRANFLAQSGLQQTIIANQLALLSLCASDQGVTNSTACANVLAAISLPSIIAALNPTPPPPPTTSTSPSTTDKSTPTLAPSAPTSPSAGTPRKSSQSLAGVIGIIAGIATSCFIVAGLYLGFQRSPNRWR